MIHAIGTNIDSVMFDVYGRFIYKFELDMKWEMYFWQTREYTEYYRAHNHFIRMTYECPNHRIKNVYKVNHEIS